MSGVVWIGEANDFMSGGAGGDFYIYECGEGQDVIDDSGAFSFGPLKSGLRRGGRHFASACNDNDSWSGRPFCWCAERAA